MAPALVMSEAPLDSLSFASFAELVHAKFQVLVEPGLEVSLELAIVAAPSPGPERVPPGSQQFEAFSLLFNGPLDRPLAQRTYRFTHERLGSFDLFIVPVSADRNARQYEAVFNRRLSPGKAG
jgi:hypothetical protein